jgi:energy-converting hydrogenase Eha subunit A
MYGSPDVLPVQQNAQQANQYPAAAAQPVAWTAPVEQPALVQPMPASAPAPSPVYQPSPGNGLTNQMIAEGGNGCVGGCNDNCGQGVCCGPCCDRLWYASFSALVLNRSPGRRLWTSSEQFPNEAIQLGNTDIPMAWTWGGEVQLGRRFCCDCTPYAIEATFWTTSAFTGSQTTVTSLDTVANPGQLIATPLETGNINFNLPRGVIVPATTIFNFASSSTVSRRDEFYDFEINLIREKLAMCCNSSWEVGWSLGVRYFRFQESLTVSAVTPTAVIAGGADAYFSDTVTNNLVGPQIGFDVAYNLGCNVRFFVCPKVGIFGNCVDSNFDAKGRQGSGAYVDGVNTVTGYPDFPAHGANTSVAFLTQVDVGLDWQFTRNWSAKAGYRVVAMTGMGLADDEFPQYLCDTPEMQNPQHNSSLVLHGAFFGLTYNF